jgi:hypothetical protein
MTQLPDEKEQSTKLVPGSDQTGAQPVELTVCDPSEAQRSDSNSVQVNLQTSGLAFQVHTQMPQNNQIIDLVARLDLVVSQLKETQLKLEGAMQRIGFLEAQVMQRDQVIDQLCKQQSEKKSD